MKQKVCACAVQTGWSDGTWWRPHKHHRLQRTKIKQLTAVNPFFPPPQNVNNHENYTFLWILWKLVMVYILSRGCLRSILAIVSSSFIRWCCLKRLLLIFPILNSHVCWTSQDLLLNASHDVSAKFLLRITPPLSSHSSPSLARQFNCCAGNFTLLNLYFICYFMRRGLNIGGLCFTPAQYWMSPNGIWKQRNFLCSTRRWPPGRNNTS